MKIIKNKNVKYAIEGKGEALLFIHGFSANPHAHAGAIKALSSEFRVIAPFVKFFMEQDKISAQLLKILEDLEVEKVIIAGHSAGGAVSMNFTNLHPEKVSKLILIDSIGVPNKGNFMPNFLKRVAFLLSAPLKHPKLLLPYAIYLHRLISSPRKLAKEQVFIKRYSQDSINFNIPTLILWGEDDRLTLTTNAYALNKIIPGSKLEFVKGSHNWLFSKPYLLLEKIKEFIK